jgi:hypothetical protein
MSAHIPWLCHPTVRLPIGLTLLTLLFACAEEPRVTSLNPSGSSSSTRPDTDAPWGNDAGLVSGDTLCTNTCRYANDGDCDDGGPGSSFSLCDLGTDCNDCGPRRPGRVTDTDAGFDSDVGSTDSGGRTNDGGGRPIGGGGAAADTGAEDPTPVEIGYYCVEIFECMNAAGEATPAVIAECKQPASARSAALFDAAIGCIQTRCASSSTQDEFVRCQNQQCGNELRACEQDLPTGSLDCNGVLQCINTSAGTAEDVRGCEASGSAVAQQQFGAIRACISANCAGITNADDFVACQQEFCFTELATCTGQTVPSGTDTCPKVVDCLLDCRGSQICADACLSRGTRASAQAAVAFYNCGVTPCGTSATSNEAYISCTRTACPFEASACF